MATIFVKQKKTEAFCYITDIVIRKFLRQSEVTTYQLDRIMGSQGNNVSWAWLNLGRAPSAMSLAKILYLDTLMKDGIHPSRIKTIDWESVPPVIQWWPNAEPKEGEIGYDAEPKAGAEGDDAGRSSWRDIPTA